MRLEAWGGGSFSRLKPQASSLRAPGRAPLQENLDSGRCPPLYFADFSSPPPSQTFVDKPMIDNLLQQPPRTPLSTPLNRGRRHPLFRVDTGYPPVNTGLSFENGRGGGGVGGHVHPHSPARTKANSTCCQNLLFRCPHSSQRSWGTSGRFRHPHGHPHWQAAQSSGLPVPTKPAACQCHPSQRRALATQASGLAVQAASDVIRPIFLRQWALYFHFSVFGVQSLSRGHSARRRSVSEVPSLV